MFSSVGSILWEATVGSFPTDPRTMEADGEARGGRGGRPGGMPNYNNDILIDIVERMLPQGLEAWREVALAYQRESNETALCRGEDFRDNWNRKLCNRMQKPTGKPGALTDRIFHCIAIELPIQDEANAAILGVNLAESGHSGDEGLSFSDYEGGGGGTAVADHGKDGPPVDDIEFNYGRGDEAGEEEEDAEVVAANTDANVPGAAVGGHPHPQSLGSSSGNASAAAVSSSASRGGGLPGQEIFNLLRGGVRH
jgi:hypothetical protein